MPEVLFIILLTAATGVGGLSLGGALAALLRRQSPRWSALLLSFTAGLMLSIVALDMVPEAAEAAKDILWVVPLFLVGGFAVTWLLNCWIDKSAHHETENDPHHCACGHHDLYTAGIVLAAAVALHNVPVGMAVGATVAVQGVCWAAALAAVTIGLHNLPEGMSIAIPLLHDGSKTVSAIAVAALSGVPTVLGALAGYAVGSQAAAALAGALGLAGGAMLYVVFFELLPEAGLQWKSKWSILATVVGFALGVLLILLPAGQPAETGYDLPEPTDAAQVAAALERRGGYVLRTAVLYSGTGGSEGWRVTLDYLRQPLVVNLEAEAVDADGPFDLSGCDVVYLDESLLSAPALAEICQTVEAYTSAGGAVLAPNGFYSAFAPEYFGASSFEKLQGYPTQLTLTQGLGDLSGLQEVIFDFHSLYGSFAGAAKLQARDYGWAMTADTAVPLVESGGQTLYAMNRYGDGYVLFVNPLLPNAYVQAAFSMTAQDGEQTPFASTAASCGQLLVNEWAAYISKQIYGFALDRVFGYYGSPSMSWELHYEEMTGIENGSMQIFSELAQQYRQVPSFTLIRSSYWWFLRAETLTYLLNGGEAGTLDFQMDYNESAYSTGTHIDSGGQWLSLTRLEYGGSYFADYPDQTQRLYPCAADYNGDGLTDFFCGSSDGGVYYYESKGFTGLDGRLKVSEAQTVMADGAPLSVGGHSAPQIMDVDGDGVPDLLVGCTDGTVRWYRGDGSLSFTDQGVLIRTDFPGQSLPAVGDVDGDGVTDLLVGSSYGLMILYYGQKDGSATRFSHDRMRAYARDCADWRLGSWLSPALADYDGDGVLDILLGSFDGYISLLHGEGDGGFSFDGYIDSDERNYKGNNHLKFGNYCTPVLCDLNGDGALDLLAGSLEYGLAYPIDSPYFPYREQLQEQANYAMDHNYYMGVHFYTNSGASAEREAWELAAHRAAMASYGLSTVGVGANQHTWYTSALDPAQSMRSLYQAGLLWQSGFGSSGDSDPAPQSKAENVVAYPFFLMDGDERTLLVQNNSVLPYRGTEWTDLSGKYQMPVCIYYHCDFVYRSNEEAVNDLQQAADFQWKHGYNFNKEDQLMRGSAAAYNLRVEVAPTENGFTITPGHISENFALYDEDAQNASGLRIDLSDTLEAVLATDAQVWKRTDGGIAVGLDGTVAVSLTGGEEEDGPHVEQVNVPAHITVQDGGAVIDFTGDGMLQAVVSGGAATTDEGWTVDRRDGRTVFTKFGGADTLHIQYE